MGPWVAEDHLFWEAEGAYLAVLGVAVWEVVLEVGGLEEDQEGAPEEDRGVALEEAPEAGDEALALSYQQAYQEAS